MFQAVLAGIKLAPAFLGALWNLGAIAVEIFKWVRQEVDKSERAKMVKEIKDAVVESRQTLDNSKLIDLLSRKKNEDS